MGKRMVETDFWQDEKVIEQFSPEDKYFMMYLLTNPKVTSIGIYKFRKKVVAFELGYTLDSVKVLLDRFENKYQMIKYNDSTQEIAVLNCLKYTINKGGKPIESMVEREIKNIDDGGLILETYNRMIDWWGKSDRGIDKSIQLLFEKELSKRKVPKENNTNTNTNTSTYTNTDTGTYRPTIRKDEEESENSFLQDLENLWGRTFNGMEVMKITDYLTNECVSNQLMKKAIETSLLNGARNFNYVSKVLDNWIDEGIKTPEQVDVKQEEYKKSNQKQKGQRFSDVQKEELKQPDEFYGF